MPCVRQQLQPRRRSKRRHQPRTERTWASPEQVLAIATQAAALVGNWAAVLIITAAWTDARGGELAGLRRVNYPAATDPNGDQPTRTGSALATVDARCASVDTTVGAKLLP